MYNAHPYISLKIWAKRCALYITKYSNSRNAVGGGKFPLMEYSGILIPATSQLFLQILPLPLSFPSFLLELEKNLLELSLDPWSL